MIELVEFLRARYDERERKAKAAAGDYPNWETTSDGNVCQVGTGGSGYLAVGPWDGDLFEVGEHIADNDPGRTLADVDAKRRIIDWCVEVIGERDLSRYGEFGCLGDDRDALAVTLAVETMRLLALPYADRPGYRAEWTVATEGAGTI